MAANRKAKEAEAEVQLRQHASDANIIRQCGSAKLHLLKVIFRGAEMEVCVLFNDSEVALANST